MSCPPVLLGAHRIVPCSRESDYEYRSPPATLLVRKRPLFIHNSRIPPRLSRRSSYSRETLYAHPPLSLYLTTHDFSYLQFARSLLPPPREGHGPPRLFSIGMLVRTAFSFSCPRLSVRHYDIYRLCTSSPPLMHLSDAFASTTPLPSPIPEHMGGCPSLSPLR